jgi:hypothetical protein
MLPDFLLRGSFRREIALDQVSCLTAVALDLGEQTHKVEFIHQSVI